MRTSQILSLALLTAAAAAACDDARPVASTAPTAPAAVPANALSAYMTVSNPRAEAGERVTVTIRALRGQNVGVVGSFTLKLAYDSTRMRLLQAGRASSGMVMANTTRAGQIVAAGASGDGFADDQLLSATFVVTGARGTASLLLDVTELNSVKFEDQRAMMRVDQKLYRAPTP